MLVNNLKELQAFLKICRKQGVDEIAFGDLKIKFGEMPVARSDQDQSDVETDEPTIEQLMFLSAPAPFGS